MTGEEPRASTGGGRNASVRKLVILGLATAVIGGPIWLWEEVLEDRFIAK